MKHNNNLAPSSHAKCKCGRYATLGELKARIGITGLYVCPDCEHYENQKHLVNIKSCTIPFEISNIPS